MRTNEILARLEYGDGEFDMEIIGEAIRHGDDIAPTLLQVLEDIVGNDSPRPERYTADIYAIHILSELRETEAHIPLLQLCLLPERRLNALFGNVLDSDLDFALANTSDGDISGIALLIEDPDACEDVRITGLKALVALAEWGDVPRQTVIECLTRLFGILERCPGFLWQELIWCVQYLGATALKRDVRSAWKDGLIEGDWEEIKRSWRKPLA